MFHLVVSQAADNLLVRVRGRFSLVTMVKACQEYRKYDGGRGQEAQYALAGLCWAILLRRLYGWNYRMLEEQVRVNLLVRWATGFALHEATPDHMVLWRFEDWLREHDLDGMFVTILQQIDDDFPEERKADFIGDTFGTRANIQDVSLTTLLRQTCQRLLAALQKALPDAYADCVPQIDHAALFGAKDEKPTPHLSLAELEMRTLRTAQAAIDCLAVVEPYIPMQHVADERQEAALEQVRHWGDTLTKILTDEFTTKPMPFKKEQTGRGAKKGKQKSATQTTVSDASAPVTSGLDRSATDGSTPKTATDSSAAPQSPASDSAVAYFSLLRRCLQEERGRFRIISAVDTDATIRNHGKSIILGYNTGVLATKHFVRYVLTFTGSTADGSLVARLIASHLALFGFSPDKYIFDRAAGTPKHIADVARASDGKTQLVARQIAYGKNSELYQPDAFTLSLAGLTCPNGLLSTHSYRADSANGWDYRFLAAQCKDCPLWNKCRKPHTKPSGHRTVFISDYTVTFRDQLAYLDSPQAKADFAFRSNVERIIAALTRFNDARRARVRGLLKVSFQNLMAATAFNLKSWFTLTRQLEKKGLKEKPLCPDRLYPLP